VLSFSLTAVVIVLVAVNAPLRAQRALRRAAEWDTDRLDVVPRPTRSTGVDAADAAEAPRNGVNA
jgi:SHS family sialic acid transporter-like MFS transporter